MYMRIKIKIGKQIILIHLLITNFDLSFDDRDLWSSAAVPLWNAHCIWSWSAYWLIAIGQVRRPKYECHHHISGITWLVGNNDFLCNEKQKKHSQISSNIFFPSKELIHRKIICFCLLLLVLLIKLEKFSIFGYWLPRVAAGYRSNNSNL